MSIKLTLLKSGETIISEMKESIFDFKGLKQMYDLLMEDVYGDNGIKGY